QLKDSAIWQAVLALAQNYSAYLVSADKGFFLDRDTAKGLAPNLLEDCQKAGVTIAVRSDLASSLKAITSDVPPFDHNRLVPLITDSLMPHLRAEAARHKFEIGEVLDTNIEAFRLPQPKRLAVDYTVITSFNIDPSVIMDGRTDCRATTRGSCYYEPETNVISGEL